MPPNAALVRDLSTYGDISQRDVYIRNKVQNVEDGTVDNYFYNTSGATKTNTVVERVLLDSSQNYATWEVFTKPSSGSLSTTEQTAQLELTADLCSIRSTLTNLTTLGVASNATVGGTLGVTGAATLSSTLAVASNSTVGGTLGVTGATTLSSTLAVASNSTVGGTMGVTGATTLSSTLGVTGAATLSSTLDVASNSTVGGTLGVTGATALSSTLAVTGATTLSSTLGVTSNVSVGGTLQATGATTLSSTLGVTSNATIGGTLAVTGLSTLTDANITGNCVIGGTFTASGGLSLGANIDCSGNLSVAGLTTLSATQINSTLDVSGATDINSTLDVSGGVSLGSTLHVTSATDLSGNLSVTGPATFGGNMTIAGPGLLIPVGNTSQRPSPATEGHVRYNTQTSQFEGYGAGSSWGSLGGVTDVDQDTYVSAETSPGANDDNLRFFTFGEERARINSTGYFGIGTNNPTVKLQVVGTTNITGSVDLSGNTTNSGTFSVGGAATLGSTLAITGTATANGALVVNGASTFNSPVGINSSVTIYGDLNVVGTATQTTIQSSMVQVGDKNIELGYLETTTLSNLNGAGITIGGSALSSRPEFVYSSSLSAWTPNIDFIVKNATTPVDIAKVDTTGMFSSTSDSDSSTFTKLNSSTLNFSEKWRFRYDSASDIVALEHKEDVSGTPTWVSKFEYSS